MLVRKEELACRNSWDQDLWEPPGEQPRAKYTPPQAVDLPAQGDGLNRPAAHADDVPAAENSGATDRVTEIAVPIERPRPPMPMTRHWMAGTKVQPDFDLPGIGGLSTLDDEPVLPSIERAEAPAAPDHDKRDSSFGTEAPTESERWRMADPYEARSTKNVPTPPLPEAARERDTRSAHVARQNGLQRQPPRPVAEAPALAHPPIMGAAGGQSTEPLPIDELNKAMENVPAGGLAETALRPGVTLPDERSSVPGFAEPQDAQGHRQELERPNEPTPHVHVDGVDLGTGQNSEFRRSAKPMAENSPEPVDRVTWISGIARCCGNCRDFRRGPDGKTGVCTNSYAFQEQPVVQSDQLACGGGRGEWWLPHDEYWLERADTSHHTRPTPYLDAALAKRQTHAGEHGRDSLDRDSRVER